MPGLTRGQGPLALLPVGLAARLPNLGTMRALTARLTAHGAPLELEEVELPEPGPGECLVEMAFGGVNPVDRYEALGRVNAGAPLPRTLGAEGSGLAEVDGEKRRVFLNRAAPARPGDGLWASHVVAREDKLIDLPAAVGLEEAAAVGVAAVTAWRCVTELGEVVPEDKVLVLGASGGVGSIVVSIAHRIGAEVVAQVGSPEKAGFTKERGADQVIVSEAASLAEELGSYSPTVVFDPLGGAFTGAAIEALAPRGRLVLFGTSADPRGEVPLQAVYRKALRVLGYGGLIESEGRMAKGVADTLAALAEGRLEVVVDKVLPLSEVNTALENLAARRVRGKQVLALS